MQTEKITVSIHRYRNYVAFNVGNGETHYINAKDAQHFAFMLERCAKDIQDQPDFCMSQIGTMITTFDGKR